MWPHASAGYKVPCWLNISMVISICCCTRAILENFAKIFLIADQSPSYGCTLLKVVHPCSSSRSSVLSKSKFLWFAILQTRNFGYAARNKSSVSCSVNLRTLDIASKVSRLGLYLLPLFPIPLRSLEIVDLAIPHLSARALGFIPLRFKWYCNNAGKVLFVLGLCFGALTLKAIPSEYYFVIEPCGPEAVCVVCIRMKWYLLSIRLATITTTSFGRISV